MAVDASTLDLHWNGSTFSGSSTEGERFTAIWRVETDDGLDQAQTVKAWFLGNVITYGALYSYANDALATLAIAKEISVRRVLPSRYLWEIQVDFSEPDSEDQDQTDSQGDRSEDPIEWVRIASGTNEYRRPVKYATYRFGYGADFETKYPQDTTGLAPMNSAFQPFANPPLERDDGREWVMLGGNIASVDTKQLYRFLWHTNSKEIEWNVRGIGRVASPGEVRIRRINIKPNQFRGVNFVEVDFILEFGSPLEFFPDYPEESEAPSWLVETVDKGTVIRACDGDPDGDPDGDGTSADIGQTVEYPPDSPRMRVPIDFNDNIIGEEFLLDGNGQPLDTCAGDHPVAGLWEFYPVADFSTIPVLDKILNTVWV
jgi:hypothetical protein